MELSKRLFPQALLLAAIVIADYPCPSKAIDQAANAGGLYQGPWVTTNRKLNGTMNCLLKQVSQDQWQGRFWGTWEHVPFDYTVQFGRNDPIAKDGGRFVSIGDKPLADGTPVIGKATIDGAHYDWIGVLSPAEFDIQFTGSRYEGHLELKRVAELNAVSTAQ